MTKELAITSDFYPDKFALDAIRNDPRLQPSTKKQYEKAEKIIIWQPVAA